MTKITNAQELRQAIVLLEEQQSAEAKILKVEIKEAYDNLNPISLITKSIKKFTSSPNDKADMLSTAISLAMGFVSKKIMVREEDGPLKKILGTVMQIGITNLVSKNTDGIKSVVLFLINAFTKKKEVKNHDYR